MLKSILENEKAKKIISYFVFCIICTLCTICLITITSKNKKIKITDTLKHFNEINNGFLELNISKNAVLEEEQEKINIVYKTLFDRNYNNENIFAVDGSLGVEVESMKLGIYLPIKLKFNDDLDFFTEIDEVYQTIIEIPEGNTKMKAKLNPIINVFYPEINLTDFKTDVLEILSTYLISNKNNFNYVKSDEQFYLFTKGIGRFNKTVSEEDFVILKDILDKKYEKESYSYKFFENIINKFNGEYTLYIYVKNNQIYKVELFNDEVNFNFNLKNINFNQELDIPEITDEYGLDFNNYLDKNNFNLLSLIGLNEDGTFNLKSILQKNFKELMSYMYLCIQYSEAGDNNSAQKYIELMTALISSIEETTNISDKDLAAFNDYIDIYKLLRQYTIIYNQQCFSTDENLILDLNDKLFETIKLLSDKMNSIGIDINEAFNVSDEEIKEEVINPIITIGVEEHNKEETSTITITPEESLKDKDSIITIGVEDINKEETPIITITPEESLKNKDSIITIGVEDINN